MTLDEDLPAPNHHGRYDLGDLFADYLRAREHENADVRLRSHFGARAAAMAKAFGIDLARPPKHSACSLFFESTVTSIELVPNPFSAVLEAGPKLQRVYEEHAHEIELAGRDLQAALMRMARDLIVIVWEVPADLTVSHDDILAAGFTFPTPPDPLHDL